MKLCSTLINNISFFLVLNIGILYSQTLLNPNFAKKIIHENELLSYEQHRIVKTKLNIIVNQSFYLNNNLPNLENLNGIYPHKGYGGITSILFSFENKNIFLSGEPSLVTFRHFDAPFTQKVNSFSVLNDAAQYNLNNFIQSVKNLGIKYKYKNFTISYGNWSQWWGPGMHSSLVMSNNSAGFYHYNIEYGNIGNVKTAIEYNIRYTLSKSFTNSLNSKFYLSGLYINGSYKNFEIGLSDNILSGGYPDLNWNSFDASLVPFNNKKIRYWDKITDFYIKYSSYKNKFVVFLQLGIPDAHKSRYGLSLDSRNTIGSNLGIRKYNAFDIEGFLFGIEYIRLLQGKFFDIYPTNNWYDNIKYDYSSHQGRRWAAHSGSDSDDFLLYFGHLGSKNHTILGLNYERHGVTFKFPPEVKFELKINIGVKMKSFYLSLIYENELIEHYSFLNNNSNIWNEEFKKGSIQRTKTLFFNIEKKL